VNARATLAYFMRGDEHLPPSAFPDSDTLIRLLGEGDALKDRFGPLKKWMTEHPLPDFHKAPPQAVSSSVSTSASSELEGEPSDTTKPVR
jgi:hypothetical protein